MNKFFEGWYFKIEGETQTIAFIVAANTKASGKIAASLQIITKENAYVIPYPSYQLSYTKNPLEITLGKNKFSLSGIHIDVKSKDINMNGYLKFSEVTPPRYNIMGPFSAIPFMECRHSVFSLWHTVSGEITLNGEKIKMDGTGYIEGDRGESFPREYLWTHCNYEENSIMLSVAEIPMLGRSFTGIIGFVYLKGKEYRIATYLGAKVVKMGNNFVEIKQGRFKLTAKLMKENSHKLNAPVGGCMSRLIKESVACEAEYSFSVSDKQILDFTTSNASFEYEYKKKIKNIKE